MKNQIKQKYVPCELKIAQFSVEHEFAGGVSGANAMIWSGNIHGWEMEADGGEYKNEKYGANTLSWDGTVGTSVNDLPGL